MIRSEFLLFCVLALIFLINVTGYIKDGDKNRDVSMIERSLAIKDAGLASISDWFNE